MTAAVRRHRLKPAVVDLWFTSCQDVTDELIESAFAPVQSLSDTPPRERAFALLERMAVDADAATLLPWIGFTTRLVTHQFDRQHHARL